MESTMDGQRAESKYIISLRAQIEALDFCCKLFYTVCNIHITPVRSFQKKQNTKASSTYKFILYVFNLIWN